MEVRYKCDTPPAEPKYKIGDMHHTGCCQKGVLRITREYIIAVILLEDGYVYATSKHQIGKDFPVHTDIGKTVKCDDEYCEFIKITNWIHEKNIKPDLSSAEAYYKSWHKRITPIMERIGKEAKKRIEDRKNGLG